MKVKEVPQDSKFYKNTAVRDMSYAVDDDGNYKMVVSEGWEVKNDALDMTLEMINEKCENVRKQVLDGELSPLAYHIEKNIMDLGLLAKYTGFWKMTIKKHLKPEKFKELDDKVLFKYAEAIRITVEELKTV
jgi:hypothetical protein